MRPDFFSSSRLTSSPMACDKNASPLILNITNGGAAGDNLRRAGLPGDILTWDDVLHEGPVSELSLEKLSEERARFIHACGRADAQAVLQRFRERDGKLQEQARYARILLWFEHDLYDQLQLIQLLDFFHRHADATGRLRLINPDRYLGMLEPAAMRALVDEERAITAAQLELASRAWSAFRQPTPESLQNLLREDLDDLPWLRMALLRLLEEYPACDDGLSRTERQLLEVIAGGEARVDRIFEQNQQRETARFMGDTSFADRIRAMLSCDRPLLTGSGEPLACPFNPRQRLSLTETGRALLAGETSWLDINPVDRWIGGVHLTPENIWCYDARLHHLRRIPLG